jgi:hypothetical protein
MSLNIVVFPAPLWPQIPTKLPAGIVNETLFNVGPFPG